MREYSKLNSTFDEASLKNDVKIFHFERKGAPVRIHLVFQAGSATAKIAGLAHFTEHMLVAGTKEYPTKELFVRQIEDLGGELSANTSTTLLRLTFEVPDKNDLGVVVDLLNEILTQALFDPKTIEKERGAILAEMDMWDANQSRNTSGAFFKVAYPNTTVANTVIGKRESINSITETDLRSFYASLANRQPVFVASGDVSIGELKALLEQVAFRTSTGTIPPLELPPVDKTSPLELLEDFSSNQTTFVVGFRLPLMLQEECMALDLVHDVMMHGRTSRLQKKLRYEKGLVYGVGGQFLQLFNTHCWTIQTAGSNQSAKEILDTLKNEIGLLVENGITAAELLAVKQYNSKSLIRDLQTSAQWIYQNESVLLENQNGPITKIDYVEQQEKIGLDFVNETVRKYFGGEKLLVAGYGRRV